MGTRYGYVRVSTQDQHLDRQLAAMRAAGVEDENIFIDRVSGKNFNRTAYLRLIGMDGDEPILREGDCLVILSLDRLGRNYEGLRKEWRRITQTIKADIKVLDMPLLDTTCVDGTLDRIFIADLVFQILSYTAAKERENLLERQKGGIDSARERGVYDRENRKGGKRRQPVDAELFESLYRQNQRGVITVSAAAKKLGLSTTTIQKRFAERQKIGEEYHPNIMPLSIPA